jgi:hypothetical protein
MLRRLLLLLAGLGTCLVAVVLWSGTAHALSPTVPVKAVPVKAVPVKAVPVKAVPVKIGAPAVPVRTVAAPKPATPAPLASVVAPVGSVSSGTGTAVAGVLHTAHHSVTTVLAHASSVSIARTVAPRRAATPRPRADVRRAGATDHFGAMHAPGSASQAPISSIPRARRTVKRPGSRGPARAFNLSDLSGRAVAPAPSSFGMPFALSGSSAPILGSWSRRFGSAAGDRPRPGFLVGTGSPG